MSTATSPVAVCNLALDYLKQAPITSITTPTTPTEVICARWYDVTRRALLRKHPWNFAIKRDQLTPDVLETPTFGYAYQYNLPNDFLRLLSIGNDVEDLEDDAYQLENGCLLMSTTASSDGTTALIRYIYDCIDVAKFDSLFLAVLALELAVNMSNKFSVTASVKKDLKEDLASLSPWGMSTDGQERRPKRIQKSKFLASRRRVGGSGASGFITFDA